MFLRTRFYLQSPICYSADKPYLPPTLDSLLAFVWQREHGHFKNSGELFKQNLIFADLPIERTGKCYHASCFFLPKEPEAKEVVSQQPTAICRKVINERHMAKHDPTRKINGSVGPMHGIIQRYWLLSTPYVDYYASVTDEQEFRRLVDEFARLGNLGKKYGIGYGRIARVEITEVEEDWSTTRNGRATRPLPKELFPKAKGGIAYSCYYAPYWFKENEAECVMPDASQYLPNLHTNELISAIQKRRELIESMRKAKEVI